ncbi:TDRD5 family protein [Megaselia abdita]
MKRSHMVKGQIAAVLYTPGRVWHRGEILQTYENNAVKVFFVDYGTIDYVDCKNIKYLPVEFSKLSKQAFRGSLSHIKPVKRRWTKEAVSDFIAMVTDLLLYAKIESIELDTNSCHISLVNTINETDIYINKEMILKEHALCDSNWDNPNLTLREKMHWTDVFPSFEMYETGNYPSYSDLGIFLANNYDYERKNDNKFIHGVDGDYTVFTNQLNFMFR